MSVGVEQLKFTTIPNLITEDGFDRIDEHRDIYPFTITVFAVMDLRANVLGFRLYLYRAPTIEEYEGLCFTGTLAYDPRINIEYTKGDGPKYSFMHNTTSNCGILQLL